jgi:hypothetical protein
MVLTPIKEVLAKNPLRQEEKSVYPLVALFFFLSPCHGAIITEAKKNASPLFASERRRVPLRKAKALHCPLPTVSGDALRATTKNPFILRKKAAALIRKGELAC